MEILTGVMAAAFLAGGVLALAALGEVLAERVGIVNLGVEGLMALGAITAIVVVTAQPNPFLGFGIALIVGFGFGVMFAVATVYWQANQVLCGLALTLLGTGLANAVGKAYSGLPARATFERVVIPYLSDIPVLGRAFFSQNVLLYLIYLILPFIFHFLMFKTRHGLNMRAAGENRGGSGCGWHSCAADPVLVRRRGRGACGWCRRLSDTRFRAGLVRGRHRRSRLDRRCPCDLCRLSTLDSRARGIGIRRHHVHWLRRSGAQLARRARIALDVTLSRHHCPDHSAGDGLA